MAKKATKTRKKIKRKVQQGIAHIKADFNNIIITITDMAGGALAWSSAGSCGFKGARKGTPFAAQTAAETAANAAKEFGLQELMIWVKGIGPGRDPAMRALKACGFDIRHIRDVTAIPHNGCRPCKKRRV